MGKQITVEQLRELQEDVERVSGQINKVQGQVYFILKNHPETRSNDGLLLCIWLQTFKGVGSIGGLLRLATDQQFNFETIRRSRQRIQAAGLFLPEDEAMLKRRQLMSVWRIVMGNE